jgi:hypothetical protein
MALKDFVGWNGSLVIWFVCMTLAPEVISR